MPPGSAHYIVLFSRLKGRGRNTLGLNACIVFPTKFPAPFIVSHSCGHGDTEIYTEGGGIGGFTSQNLLNIFRAFKEPERKVGY